MANLHFGDYEFSRHQRKLTTALGFLAIGIGVGALTTLLVAPKSGKQVRKDVRRSYEDAREAIDSFTDRAGDIWDRREQWADAARRTVEPVTRRFRRG